MTKDELQADLEHFLETEKTRKLNSFEKGIKEEIETEITNRLMLEEITNEENRNS